MDTPERNQIGTPISKFEDSPVFNYINSLSPIKPVKSLHITQTFSSLSFASLPSVFTSPHVSSHRESRFLRRHNDSDPSKPESSSENGNKDCTNEGAQLYNNNCDQGISVGETSVEAHNEHSKFVIELPRTLKYDCGSPDCDPTPCGVEADCASELADPSTSIVPYVQEASEKSSDGEAHAHLQGMCQIGQKKEGTVCDWESLISDAADLFIFNSPCGTDAFKGLIENSVEPVTRFCTSLVAQFPENDINNGNEMQIVDTVSIEPYSTEDPSSQPFEADQLKEMENQQNKFANTNSNKGVAICPSETKDNEVEACMAFACKSVFNVHRGIRRRCLDFEMAGARRKNIDDGSNCSSSISQSDEKIITNDKQLVSIKPGSDSSRRILPGIGLHLNALATTSKDYNSIKNENFSSGRHLSLPNSTASIHSPTASQEPLHNHKSLIPASSERDTDATDNGVQLLEDASQEPTFSEEYNQNSPKKKRRRLENAGEGESCKRCNCKKSKCLKLYCECFAAGVYCIEPCSCQDCFNKPIHEDTVLATRKQIESRNPLAFAPKVIRSSEPVPEFGDESNKTPASARHKRGCNCKKSSCLKKYCECYQGGVGCSIGCRCEGCKNAFGRKDGSAIIGTEVEPEEDEAEANEKNLADRPSQKIEIQNNEEQTAVSAHPITPLQASRPLIPLPFSSKSKHPRSSFLTIAASSSLYTGLKLGKPNILRTQPKFEKQIQTFPNTEDEMPEILRGDCSPSTGVKTSSPNSKRISPPHCNLGSSPGRRSGRKLILQSIPSFPSLSTPQSHR